MLSLLQAKKFAIVIHDLSMTALAVIASIVLRFDYDLQANRIAGLGWWIIGFTVFAGFVYGFFDLYKSKWRFASLPDIISITKSVLVLTITALIADYILAGADLYGGYFLGRKTIIIYALVQTVLLALPRFAYRYWKDRGHQLTLSTTPAAPSILIGRSYDVEYALRAIQSGALRGVNPQAILSPRRADYGQSIRGVPVAGPPGALADTVADFQRQNIFIRRILVLPSALTPESEPDKLFQNARKLGLSLSRLQALDDDSTVIAPVRIEDLLLRQSFTTDGQRLSRALRGKRVAVTGAGGSIGSSICLKLAEFGVSSILLLENSEPALYAISEQLATEHRKTPFSGHICDVRDRTRLFELLSDYKPDLVFHAAALKHVPYLEKDWEEGIRTNIYGSANVADATVAVGAEAFVMISTDKAIEPVSMLGATKRFAEIYTEALDSRLRQASGPTRLISVRFGNVLGSNGSVVPKFKAQIERGGPITVTHPDMVRYFMTVGEAADLVLTSALHACDANAAVRASTYVLKMGKPVRVLDLAERMVRLSGFEPDVDIEIAFTGIRPGERLNEILFAKDEKRVDIGEEGVLAAQTNSASLEAIVDWRRRLDDALERHDRAVATAVFTEAIPTFAQSGVEYDPELEEQPLRNAGIQTQGL